MLRYLRENTGNWIIKIFLGIIVIVFVFLGVGSFSSNRNNSVATINDEPITIKEYQQAYKQVVEQYRARFGNNLNEDLLKVLNAKQQALDGLIEQKIILSEAEKLKITVSNKELQDSLLSIKAFQKDGKFDLDQYKAILSRNSMNPEIFEAGQIEALRQGKVKSLVYSSVNVTDMEAKDWYTFQNEKVAVDYLLFAPGAYTDIDPAEKKIKKHYTDNKDNYKSEPKLKAVYLKFSPADHKDEITVSQEDIQAYYEQQQEKYKVPEKVEARHILIKVDETDTDEAVKKALERAQEVYQMAAKGQDFEALAKKYSEGPSKTSGGYLGTFEKRSMVKPFADKAFSMKADEISEPVKTRFGWHIIKVLAKSDATIKTLEQVSSDIKKELGQQETQNLAYYKAGEAFDAVIDGDDFEQVALIADKKIQQTKAFSINGEGLPIADNSGFAREAFSLPVDSISDVKQLGEDYYLIKVVEKIDPELQKFDQVRDQVKKDLVAILQEEQAKKDAKKAVAKAVDAKSLVPAAGKYNLEIKSTKLFARNSNIEIIGNLPEFTQAGFSLSKENMIHSEIIESKNGYYVLGFKQKKQPEESEINDNLKTVKNELNWRKQLQSYQAWMAELKKQYDIEYDPKVLN